MSKALEKKITALENAIKSPATNAEHKPAMEIQLGKLRAQLSGPTSEWGTEDEMDELNSLSQGDKAAISKAAKIYESLTSAQKKKFYAHWIEVNGEFGVDTEGNKLTNAVAKKTMEYLLYGGSNGKSKGAKKQKPEKKKKKTKLSPDECKEAIEEITQRRKKFKESGRKYRTKSISEKVGANIATAVNLAVKNIPAEKLNNAPKEMFKKIEKLHSSADQFFTDFRAVLGEDYDKSDAKEALDKISTVISDLKKKYSE